MTVVDFVKKINANLGDSHCPWKLIWMYHCCTLLWGNISYVTLIWYPYLM